MYNYKKFRDKIEVGMQNLSRITFNPEVMGGKPCVRECG